MTADCAASAVIIGLTCAACSARRVQVAGTAHLRPGPGCLIAPRHGSGRPGMRRGRSGKPQPRSGRARLSCPVPGHQLRDAVASQSLNPGDSRDYTDQTGGYECVRYGGSPPRGRAIQGAPVADKGPTRRWLPRNSRALSRPCTSKARLRLDWTTWPCCAPIATG